MSDRSKQISRLIADAEREAYERGYRDAIAAVTAAAVAVAKPGVPASDLAAPSIGISLDRLKIISGDTALVPNEGVTAGSASMPSCAPAVQQAAAEVREILLGLAATKLGQPVDGMTVQDGTITAANGKSAPYWDLVAGREFERQATGVAKLRPISEHGYIRQIDSASRYSGHGDRFSGLCARHEADGHGLWPTSSR
jgi:hypothetical protein